MVKPKTEKQTGVNGGKRSGAGRRAGGKNKATILRETKRAEVIAALVDSGKPLAVTVLQKAMEFAEGAVAAYRPTMKAEEAALAAQGKKPNEDGDHAQFGQWFDRWVRCIEVLSSYQTPKMKAMDAPTAAPDINNPEGPKILDFELRVFEGGRAIAVQKDDAA